MDAFVLQTLCMLDRRGGGGCSPVVGCFVFIMAIGFVVFLVMKGRRDRPEQIAAGKRPMPEGPVEAVQFASPYAKCPACGAPGDKMKHQWDGMRKVSWSCGYCGSQAGVQELRDEELPQSARRRLGLDQLAGYDQPGVAPQYPQGGGSGMGGVMGGVLGGMMLGSMMGGDRHHHHSDSWGGSRDDGWGGSSGGDAGWGSDGGSSGGSADWGESDGGGSDWGDSGGGDSGGDSGGDW